MPTVGRPAPPGTSPGASPEPSTGVPAGQEPAERGRKLPCQPDPAPVRDAVHAYWLAESGRRDRELAARLSAWREGFAAGMAEGIDVGHGLAMGEIAEEKRMQVGIVQALRDSAPPAGRWHVCCRACRLGRHRPGCRRCEDRTRETFGQPHPDDYPGQDGAA